MGNGVVGICTGLPRLPRGGLQEHRVDGLMAVVPFMQCVRTTTYHNYPIWASRIRISVVAGAVVLDKFITFGETRSTESVGHLRDNGVGGTTAVVHCGDGNGKLNAQRTMLEPTATTTTPTTMTTTTTKLMVTTIVMNMVMTVTVAMAIAMNMVMTKVMTVVITMVTTMVTTIVMTKVMTVTVTMTVTMTMVMTIVLTMTIRTVMMVALSFG